MIGRHRAPCSQVVLIDIAAAGVNNADLLERQGAYPALADGGYAEEVVVPAGQVMPLRRGLSMVQAAAPAVISAVISAHSRFNGQHDFVPATLEATKGRRVDAILDVVGAPNLERNLKSLAHTSYSKADRQSGNHPHPRRHRRRRHATAMTPDDTAGRTLTLDDLVGGSEPVSAVQVSAEAHVIEPDAPHPHFSISTCQIRVERRACHFPGPKSGSGSTVLVA